MVAKRIFISTGEVSGDLQGSLLVAALLDRAKARGIELEIVALGGDRMVAAGASLVGNTTRISSLGIIEAIGYILPTYLVQQAAKRYLSICPPDLTILIDYIGSNVGIGSFVKKILPNRLVIYYIAPQEWVWALGEKNTNSIAKFTDRLLAIFPGEATYYTDRGVDAKFVGHPLVDRVATISSKAAARKELGIAETEVAIALIPASRRQELKYLMPFIFQAAQQLQEKIPQVRFWIPLARKDFQEAIEAAIVEYNLPATIVSDRADCVLAAADLAIAKCGTVSLELALLDVPQVVIYRVSKITALIAQYILKLTLSFVSPTNLVVMEPLIPELIQDDATADRIFQESMALLFDEDCRSRTFAGYAKVRSILGSTGVCDRAANEILDLLEA